MFYGLMANRFFNVSEMILTEFYWLKFLHKYEEIENEIKKFVALNLVYVFCVVCAQYHNLRRN